MSDGRISKRAPRRTEIVSVHSGCTSLKMLVVSYSDRYSSSSAPSAD